METEQQQLARKDLGEFLQQKKLQEAARKANAERSAANAKRKLEGVIRKKFETSIIGGISRIEEHLGHLWGHDEPEGAIEADIIDLEGLTDEEAEAARAQAEAHAKAKTEERLAYRQLWDILRTEILNNGNNQLRAVQEELGRYTLAYEGYQLKMPIKPKTQDSEE